MEIRPENFDKLIKQEEIGDIKSVKIYDVSGEWVNLPEEIFLACNKIEHLELMVKNLETIPESLQHCKLLKSIHFCEAKLEKIPDWIGDLEL